MGINMKKIKFLGMLVMMVLFMLIPEKADAANVDVNMIARTHKVEYSSGINLYNWSNEIIAVKYDLSPIGYVIVDVNNGQIIELCETRNNEFISEKGIRYYYNNVLDYYAFKQNNLINNNQQNSLVDMKEAGNVGELGKVVIDKSNKHALSHPTFAFSYNPDGRCGSVAAAILLKYYDQYVDDNIVPVSLQQYTGVNLINKLKSYIEPNGGGSNYTTLKNGINNYLKWRGLKRRIKNYLRSDDPKKVLSKIKNKIHVNCPVIVGLASHPTYKNHWVVCIGYRGYLLFINDGWGNRDVACNFSYVDGVLFF